MKNIKSLLGLGTPDKSNQRGYGGRGEDEAAKYLKKQGLKIIARNWYNPGGKRLGEIDVIAREGNEIVFVEVKTRKVRGAVDYTLPEESITPTKVHKLARVAECYIKQYKLWDESWRIDAISIVYDRSDQPTIRYIKNIFY